MKTESYKIEDMTLERRLSGVAKAVQLFDQAVPEYDGNSADRKADHPDDVMKLVRALRHVREQVDAMQEHIGEVFEDCLSDFSDRSEWRWE